MFSYLVMLIRQLAIAAREMLICALLRACRTKANLLFDFMAINIHSECFLSDIVFHFIIIKIFFF